MEKGESSTQFFSNLKKKDKTYLVVAASGIGGFFFIKNDKSDGHG